MFLVLASNYPFVCGEEKIWRQIINILFIFLLSRTKIKIRMASFYCDP